MANVVGIVSGKGGVGKTTLAANLGIAFSNFNKDVTLIDCNLTTSHLGFCFGLNYYPKTLNQVLSGAVAIEDAMYNLYGIKVVPSSIAIEQLQGVDIMLLKDKIAILKDTTDLVILDSAPGLGREALGTFNACDELLFVTTPYLNAVSDVIKCNNVARSMDKRVLGIVLNMAKNDPHQLRVNEVENLTKLEVIDKIPYDKNIERSLAKGVPTIVYKPYCKSSRVFRRLAATLLNEPYREPRRAVISGMWDSFKEMVAPRKNFEFTPA